MDTTVSADKIASIDIKDASDITQLKNDTTNTDKKTTKSFVNKNSGNITSNIAKSVANLPQVAPDWTNRRRIIFLSMYFIGGCLGFIVVVIGVISLVEVILSGHGQLDNNVASIMSSIIYTLTTLAGTIIGAYCFSAAYEHMNYRSTIMDMVSKIAVSGEGNKPDDSDKKDNSSKKDNSD